MRRTPAEWLFLTLFMGGLVALGLVPIFVAACIRDEALGQYWAAWLIAPVCMIACWLAVPWLVRWHGGAKAVDEAMRRDAERARQPGGFGVPLVAWLTTKGVEGSLRAKGMRRRYGHLAVMPFPALLLVWIVLVQSTNSAFSGPYEPVNCMVVKLFIYRGEANRAFVCRRATGEALEEGLSHSPLPDRFVARARRGSLGVWLLDRSSVRPE